MKHLYEIISIFMKYADETYDNHVFPEGDSIFVEGPYPNQLSKEDAEKLAGLPCAFDDKDEIWEIFFGLGGG